MNELEQALLSRELEKSLLEELVQQAEEEEQVLFVLRAEQQQLLKAIKQEKNIYQLAVDEMRKAEQELYDDLMRLRIEEKLDKEQGLLLGKGHLSSPVTGTVLYRFGDIIQTGVRKGDTIQGITVAIESGTTVHAVYKGKVVLADYKRGYGNAVIIDHGGNTLPLQPVLMKFLSIKETGLNRIRKSVAVAMLQRFMSQAYTLKFGTAGPPWILWSGFR